MILELWVKQKRNGGLTSFNFCSKKCKSRISLYGRSKKSIHFCFEYSSWGRKLELCSKSEVIIVQILFSSREKISLLMLSVVPQVNTIKSWRLAQIKSRILFRLSCISDCKRDHRRDDSLSQLQQE